MAELGQIINTFKSGNDPVAFYTLKKRIQIKQEILEKLKEIKKYSDKTNETLKPMYPHKFEKEIKESFYSVYYRQTETD